MTRLLGLIVLSIGCTTTATEEPRVPPSPTAPDDAPSIQEEQQTAAPASASETPEPSPIARCEKGDQAICFELTGRLDSLPPDELTRLLSAFERLCKVDARGACVNVAALESTAWPGHPPNYDKALPILLPACERGVASACANAAWMYRMGKGTSRDPSIAFKLATLGCEKNEPKACNSLGDMFETGDGTEKDLDSARELYERVCFGPRAKYLTNAERQHNVGCWSLGLLYQKGIGVRPDAAKASKLLTQACGAGVSGACKALAEASPE